MRGFYLGPDDRYPRALYWTTILMFACDTAIAVLMLTRLVHNTRAQQEYYYYRNVMGHLAEVICPLIMVALVLIGSPRAILFFVILKFISLLTLAGNFYGIILMGAHPHRWFYGALGAWYLFTLIIAVSYYVIRSRDEED